MLEDQPDLVLLDIYLPDLGGLEVCRRLRAAGNLVDVIAVTAARDVETVRAATGLGIAQYLVKPFAFATFREKLERYSAYRARATKGGEAGQDEIDAMLGELRSSTAIPLPKGLSRETLDLVARTLREADTALGAAETADAAGLSRVTARRYLEHLVSEGSVELELQVRRRPPGAPVPLGGPLASAAVPSFRAAYLIHGDDHGRIAERRAKLRAMAEDAAGSAGVEVYEADACTPDNVAAALSTMTFALGRRFVIADGVERWKDSDVEPVAQALHSADPETLTVAFFAREEGRYKVPAKLVQAVEKAGGQIAAELNVKSWDLPKWLIEQAQAPRPQPRQGRRQGPRGAGRRPPAAAAPRAREARARARARMRRSAPTRSTRPAPPPPSARCGRSPTRSSPATAGRRSSC